MPEPEGVMAVLFDAGGVLNRAVDKLINNEAAKTLKAPKDAVVKAIRKFEPEFQTGDITEHEFWKRVAKELSVDPVPDRIWGMWGRTFERVYKVNEDTVELAKRLRYAGYKTGILSNTEMPHVNVARRKRFFTGFDPLIFSCEVGLRKPGKEIFQLALDRLGLSASQVAYTDDNESKLAGAKELGMHTHVFKDAAGLEKWLMALGLVF